MPIELRLARLLLGAAALGGCARYEYRSFDCGPEPPPTSASAIAWAASPLRRGVLSVRVTSVEGADSLAARLGASVGVAGARPRGVRADGVVRFDSLPPGRHEVIVRAVGHRAAHATVVLPADSGVVAQAVMAPYRIALDGGCGDVYYRARKPWWTVW